MTFANPDDPDPTQNPSVYRLTVRLLQRRTYSIPAHGRVSCSLWLLRPTPQRTDVSAVYALGMEGFGSRRLYRIGTDPTRAMTLFELLVRNTVTPCTLGEILADLSDE